MKTVKSEYEITIYELRVKIVRLVLAMVILTMFSGNILAIMLGFPTFFPAMGVVALSAFIIDEILTLRVRKVKNNQKERM